MIKIYCVIYRMFDIKNPKQVEYTVEHHSSLDDAKNDVKTFYGNDIEFMENDEDDTITINGASRHINGWYYSTPYIKIVEVL